MSNNKDMKLYTLEITFSDFTYGVEQYESNSVEEAVSLFFKEAECFANYDRNKMVEIMERRLKDGNALIHVANGLRGVWLINTGAELHETLKDELPALYGGRVIQTDPHAPRRT